MYFLIIGTALFFTVHLYSSFSSRILGRDIRERFGMAKFMGLYSLFAGLGFVLIIWGYGLARPSPQIYTPPTWGVHVAMALMLPAFILLMAAYGPRGHIKQLTRHPFLYSVILWSGSHLAVNGELNSLILFGSFLAYAVIDRFAVMNRAEDAKRTHIFGDVYAVVIGTLLYWLMTQYLHPMMIGVPIIASP